MGRVVVYADRADDDAAGTAEEALRAGGMPDATVRITGGRAGGTIVYEIGTELDLEPSTEAWARGIVVESLTRDPTDPLRRIVALEHTLADLLARLAPVLVTLAPADPAAVQPIPQAPPESPPFPRPGPPDDDPGPPDDPVASNEGQNHATAAGG